MAQRAFTSLGAVIVEAVHGAARNAERLPWSDADGLAVHGPCLRGQMPPMKDARESSA